MKDVFVTPGVNPVTGKLYKYAVMMDSAVYAVSDDEKQANAQFEMHMARRPATSKQWILKNQHTNTILRGPTSNPTGKATAVAATTDKK